MRKLIITTLLAIASATITADAQFYQMSGGSYMTGYGQVHGSFGYAMATQQLYQTTQMQIQRLTMRAATRRGPLECRDLHLRCLIKLLSFEML